MRGMAPMPSQQGAMIAGAMPSSQASSQPPQPKGSIMSGYPVRTQATTSQFQATPTPAVCNLCISYSVNFTSHGTF